MTADSSRDTPAAVSPFSVRLRKPYWLLMCPATGRTAVYGVYGDLIADHASDELVAFGVEHFAEIALWSSVAGSTRPNRLASWMTPEASERCFLFALRDLTTSTSTVVATPDR